MSNKHKNTKHKKRQLNITKNIEREKAELKGQMQSSKGSDFDVLENAVQSNALSLLRAEKDLKSLSTEIYDTYIELLKM